MPDPAADVRPHFMPKALGGVAALACVAYCALPVLITAGVRAPQPLTFDSQCLRARQG